MGNEKLQEYLNKSTLNKFDSSWRLVPRYQHIERLGNTEVEGILDGPVAIQTKIDGSNLTVAYDKAVGVIIASRNNVISVGGNPISGFNGAIEYILRNSEYYELAQEYILRGEWLVPHTIRYPKEVYHKFYIFDVQKYETFDYLTPEEYEPMLDRLGLPYIKSKLVDRPTADDLIKLIPGPDEFGAEQKEGIVIKRYNFINRYGRVNWAKLVSKEFKEQSHLMMGSTKKDDPELRFAEKNIDQAFILKIIGKIKDENEGKIDIKKMSQILGIAWYDTFTEELWDFVKQNKITVFDFGKARKLIEQKTRQIALDYFNGLIKET